MGWVWGAVVAVCALVAAPAGAQAPQAPAPGEAAPCPPAPRDCAVAQRFGPQGASAPPARWGSEQAVSSVANDPPRIANRIVGGLLGALVGFGVGLWAGQAAASDRPVNEQEWAGIDEALVGSAVGAPLAAFLLDGSRGRVWPSLAVSAGLALTGYATESGWLLGLAPVYGVVLGAVLR